MRSRHYFLFIFLLLLSGNTVYSQSLPTRANQLSAFLLGYGARAFLSWYTKAALEDPKIKNALEQKIPKEALRGKEEAEKREILARGLTTGLLASLSTYLKDISLQAGFTNSSARALTDAFSAGEKFPFLVKFLRSTWDVGTRMTMTMSKLLKETGYATVGNVRKAIDDFMEVAHAVGKATNLEEAWNYFVRATQGTPASDLTYPIKPYHGTMMTCGTNDPYCFSQAEKESQKAIDDLKANPDAIALNLARLFLQTTTVSAGLAFAIISYEIGASLAHMVAIDILGPALPQAVSLVIEKALRRYSDLTIVDELNNWLLHSLESIDKKLITPKDMGTGIYTGMLGRGAQLGIYPIEKKFLTNLYEGAQ